MSQSALSVRGVGKRYRIGEAAASRDSLVSTLQEWLTSPARNLRRLRQLRRFKDEEHETILWALRDVSFDVQPGEVVGVIGRNGAGKSTLLKVLSRITAPTVGDITIRGRVGSLLEVGTGFHPELTGRENVFLNGTILGMRKAEVGRRFDEIVEFSGVSKFLDTPVKRYSSGMRVRLAFAVAAHLDPEILIIDEVLAVGDMAFRKKCLEKMEQVSSEGRTVLFVSHSMESVSQLCGRTILLENGRVVIDGKTPEVIPRYYAAIADTRIDVSSSLHDTRVRRGSGAMRFNNVEILDLAGERRNRFRCGESVVFKLGYTTFEEIDGFSLVVGLRGTTSRDFIVQIRRRVTDERLPANRSGEVVVTLRDIPLRTGLYPTYFWLGPDRRSLFDVLDDLTAPLSFESDADLTEPGALELNSTVEHRP